MKTPANAWIHRQSPRGNNRLEQISLPKSVIVNGWSRAGNLIPLGNADWGKFRERIKKSCYPKDKNYVRAGLGAASVWKFLWEMKNGDWIVVPHQGGVFYLAEVAGAAYWDGSKTAIECDSCFRRPVVWLNSGCPIARNMAKSGLRSRMKTQQTTASALDLIAEIADALKLAFLEGRTATKGTSKLLFVDSLRRTLSEATLKEILSGHMDERGFEQLIQRVLCGMGAVECVIIPRRKDAGVDIRASFALGPTQIEIGVQAKYHRSKTEAHWLDHFAAGLRKEGISIGWFITSGELSDDFDEYAMKLSEKHGCQIHAIGGADFAALVVDHLGKWD